MGRAPCCEKEGLKKGPWTPEEDKILIEYVHSNGHGSWRSLPKLAGLLRCGKSCRLRWTNYLRPDIKRGPFTPDEQKSIVQLHAIVGNKWSTIAAQLPGRTDNEVKNYWNTHLKKRLVKMGIDPDTCSPAANADAPVAGFGVGGGDGDLLSSKAATRHMAQWESARLEAEARLAKESFFSCDTESNTTESNTGPHKMEADFFLRIWNSDVGRAFRSNGERVVPSSSLSSSKGERVVPSSLSSSKGERVVPSSLSSSSSSSSPLTTTSSTTSEVEDESYQIFLDFAAVDVDDSMAMRILYPTTQLGSLSLFDMAGNEMDGGECSTLEHVNVFKHHHLPLLEMPASTTSTS